MEGYTITPIGDVIPNQEQQQSQQQFIEVSTPEIMQLKLAHMDVDLKLKNADIVIKNGIAERDFSIALETKARIVLNALGEIRFALNGVKVDEDRDPKAGDAVTPIKQMFNEEQQGELRKHYIKFLNRLDRVTSTFDPKSKSNDDNKA